MITTKELMTMCRRFTTTVLLATAAAAAPAAASTGEWDAAVQQGCTGGVPVLMCTTSATADGTRLRAGAAVDTGGDGRVPYAGSVRGEALALTRTSRVVPGGRSRWTFDIEIGHVAARSDGDGVAGGAEVRVFLIGTGEAAPTARLPAESGRHRVTLELERHGREAVDALVTAAAGATASGTVPPEITYGTTQVCRPRIPIGPLPPVIFEVLPSCVPVPDGVRPPVVRAARGTASGEVEVAVLGVEVESGA
jgi:hypothetical protein